MGRLVGYPKGVMGGKKGEGGELFDSNYSIMCDLVHGDNSFFTREEVRSGLK